MARESAPAEKQVRLTREEARIVRHCQARGIEVPNLEPNVDDKGNRVIYGEYHPDRQDEISEVRRMKNLGYTMTDETDNRRRKYVKEQSAFLADRAQAHAAHQRMVQKDHKPQGAFDSGELTMSPGTKRTQITDIDDVLRVSDPNED
jgi:hypothetical protein